MTEVRQSKDDVWVFGYASLMWKPDFKHIEAKTAHLYGYHRSLCVYSYLYRGTPEKPGIVAGLLPGGSCKGIAFRVAAKEWDQVHKTLHDREMVYQVYNARWMEANINGNRQKVFGYIANPQNEQFAGDLSEEKIASLIKYGIGTSGTGIDYLQNTLQHMAEIGIRDQKLERLLARVKQLD